MSRTMSLGILIPILLLAPSMLGSFHAWLLSCLDSLVDFSVSILSIRKSRFLTCLTALRLTYAAGRRGITILDTWWNSLTADEQESVAFSVRLLQEQGIHLKRPHADAIHGSMYSNMRELRCQHEGRPYRVLYAFDPRRTAMLLIGGDKNWQRSVVRRVVPKADMIYAQHLKEIDA